MMDRHGQPEQHKAANPRDPNACWVLAYGGSSGFQNVSGARCVVKPLEFDVQVTSPLALPGQFVIYEGRSVRVSYITVVQDHNGYQSRYEWQYTLEGIHNYNIRSSDLAPHPRPDHGGQFLSHDTVANARAMERHEEKLDKVIELLTPPPPPEPPAPVQKAASTDTSADVFLSSTLEGARDGAYATVFILLAEKLQQRYKGHVKEEWLPALPWALCALTYVATLVFDKVPAVETIRDMAAHGARGTATILTSRLAIPIRKMVDSVLQEGRELE